MSEVKRQCSKCWFIAPLSEWGLNSNGSVFNLCEACRQVFRTVYSKRSDADKISDNIKRCEKYRNNEDYRNNKILHQRVINNSRVICEICQKEMNHSSLSRHIGFKRCKIKIVH
jgi:hypothetical protein